MSHHQKLSDYVSPLDHNIIFKFTEEVRNGFFVDKSKNSNIILDLGSNHAYSSQQHRRGVVHAIGPDVKGINVGDVVMVQHLQWTTVINIFDEPHWMTNSMSILGIVERE